ncbi:kelch repeat and BTB domain-containing protein 13 [Hypomesus transpacificus]|uniref:kelch repeat and BTB domain-containing protein 13 n=1 Tax=Hypomesus transpacificus TaxID=137520 RepID=UPI001F071D10|nr:kelch repeat and BTB domain-containing protein 13 [Hypomesus transpacificus]
MKIDGGVMMEPSSCLGSGADGEEPAPVQPPQPVGMDVLKVRVDETVFVVDKALVTQHCEYFRALFQSGMRECQQEEIHLRELGAGGFLMALRVLSGERPMLSGDEIVEAIECASFLQVDSLTKHLINILNSDNCVLMYHTAATYGQRQLSHSAALFIRDMDSELREELGALPRELVEYIESLSPGRYMVVCTHSPTIELLQNSQRTVCFLDEEERDWKVLTQLPVNASTTMAGVTVLDNKLYIVGGVHDVSKKVVDTGYCYSPESDSWSLIPSPQQPRYNFTLIGHEGYLYALGGEFERKAMASVERYMVSTGTWSFASDLPCPVASVVSTKAMSRIFISLWKSKGATEIQEYLPEKDRWVVETTLVRHQSYGHCMVAHRDNLYVISNGPGEDFLLCVMDCYNLTSGQWTAMPGQYGNSKGALFTAVVIGDSVFTLNRKVTTEYSIEEHRWRMKREMTGFGRIGSMYTFLLRMPNAQHRILGNSHALIDGLSYGTRINHRPRSSLQCLD